jgi:hypothetical protein
MVFCEIKIGDIVESDSKGLAEQSKIPVLTRD